MRSRYVIPIHQLSLIDTFQESTLAQLVTIEARTDVYAWFSVSSTLGMAAGLSISGWITYILRTYRGWDWKETYPVIFGLYAVIGIIKACLTLLLTERCEPNYDAQTEADLADRGAAAPLMTEAGRRTSYTKPMPIVTSTMRKIGKTTRIKLSPESRGILIRLCILFGLNSFAQALLPVTLMAWYANWRYRWFVLYRIGYAMAAVWVVASIANLFSASVARRLGLVRAMVFTHLPNAIFLAFIPLASSWWWLLILLLLSSAFGSMDQAPRSAFVAAVFLPEERTVVMGTINLVKTLAAVGGPFLTGYFHDRKMWHATFWISAAIKVCYDIGLLAMFLNTTLPEQGRRPREGLTVSDVDVGILLSEDMVHPDEFAQDMDDDDDMDESSPVYRPDAYGKPGYNEIERV